MAIFFGTHDKPVLVEESRIFWASLTEDEQYEYLRQMGDCWDWWTDQGPYSVMYKKE